MGWMRTACVSVAITLGLLTMGAAPANAVVSPTVISTAEYPLALDVDSAGNVWIGYANGPDPKGVTVVPAANGTLFNVPVTAGVETQIFALNGIQGIHMSQAGDLFVSVGSGGLYVATETDSNVFGQATTADTLTPITLPAASDGRDFFRGGLAMDSAGNLFGARMDWGGVSVLPASPGTVFGQAVTANTPQLLNPAGLPWGGWDGDLAIDSSDNLYVNTWFTNTGPNGVYVLPRATGTLYGQSVTANTLARLAPFDGVVFQAAGIDVDGQDNIIVSNCCWDGNTPLIWMLSASSRTVMGQALTANVAASLQGSAGNVSQGVAISPNGGFIVTGAFTSTRKLVPVSTPTVSSVSPSSGPIAGGTSVTISGTDLTGATSVRFGGSPATAFSVVSGTTIVATTPTGSAGVTDVQVTTPGGSATSPGAFTYMNPAPMNPAPRIPPGPPLNVTAESTLLGARVSWDPPADEGTDALTHYAVRSWPGARVCQVSATVTACEATGLDPEVDYYFTVVPMSLAGWGTPSASSNVIRPVAPRAPGAPTSVTASAGDQQGTVAWVAPTDSGSSPIEEYRVTSEPEGAVCASSASSCVVSGLTNGISYTFTVQARNVQGWGPASAVSNAVTPQSPSLSATAQRTGRVVLLEGMSVSIPPGSTVQIWMRIDRESEFVPASALVTVGSDGAFTWQRRLNPRKSIALFAESDGVRSQIARLSAQGNLGPTAGE